LSYQDLRTCISEGVEVGYHAANHESLRSDGGILHVIKTAKLSSSTAQITQEKGFGIVV